MRTLSGETFHMAWNTLNWPHMPFFPMWTQTWTLMQRQRAYQSVSWVNWAVPRTNYLTCNNKSEVGQRPRCTLSNAGKRLQSSWVRSSPQPHPISVILCRGGWRVSEVVSLGSFRAQGWANIQWVLPFELTGWARSLLSLVLPLLGTGTRILWHPSLPPKC